MLISDIEPSSVILSLPKYSNIEMSCLYNLHEIGLVSIFEILRM